MLIRWPGGQFDPIRIIYSSAKQPNFLWFWIRSMLYCGMTQFILRVVNEYIKQSHTSLLWLQIYKIVIHLDWRAWAWTVFSSTVHEQVQINPSLQHFLFCRFWRSTDFFLFILFFYLYIQLKAQTKRASFFLTLLFGKFFIFS
jgi:hypothetical protein